MYTFPLLPFFRKELEEVQAQNPDKFKLWYTVDRPTEGKGVGPTEGKGVGPTEGKWVGPTGERVQVQQLDRSRWI